LVVSGCFAGRRKQIVRVTNFVGRAALRASRTSTTSVAYFVIVVRAGTHLRAFLSKAQVGTDYLDGHSNFVVQ
jgi:hypothetical protein